MMRLLCVAFVLVICTMAAYGADSEFLNCDWISTLDCSTYNSTAECGTDGITYQNRCYFAKNQCLNDELHIKHDGECLPAEASTPGPGIDGETVILDFFCLNLSHKECHTNSTQTEEVCGTDGWTYTNYCEYEKERCTHRELHIENFGPCVDGAK